MALKRHEKPPPGYFQNFSNNVMARINAAEGDAESQWLLNLWKLLVARPVTSGAVAALCFGLALFLLSQSPTTSPSTANPLLPGKVAATPGQSDSGISFYNPFVEAAPDSFNSVSPVLSTQKPPSLFSPVQHHTDRVNFSPPGN